MNPTDPGPFNFEAVLAEELGEIKAGRSLRKEGKAPPEEGRRVAPDRALEEAHGMRLAGLAFSGGGIRSATFNLGVLEALAELQLLPLFDYLSTVSGGGYIGSLFAAWVKRRGLKEVADKLAGRGLTREEKGRILEQLAGRELAPKEKEETLEKVRAPQLTAKEKEEVLEKLAGRELAAREKEELLDQLARCDLTPEEKAEGPDPIRFLRQYSNYLTPRVGIFGADTWTVATTWLSNTLLNQAILIGALVALLLAPRVLALTWEPVRKAGEPADLGLAALIALWIFLAVRMYFRSLTVIVPIGLLAAAVWKFAPRSHATLFSWDQPALPLALLFLAISFSSLNLGSIPDPEAPPHQPPRYRWYNCQGAVVSFVVAPVFLAAWFLARWIWLGMTSLDLCRRFSSDLPSSLDVTLGLIALGWAFVAFVAVFDKLLEKARIRSPIRRRSALGLSLLVLAVFRLWAGPDFYPDLYNTVAGPERNAWLLWSLCGGVVYFALWCGGWVFGLLLAVFMEIPSPVEMIREGLMRRLKEGQEAVYRQARLKVRSFRTLVVYAFVSGALGAALARALALLFCRWWREEECLWHALAFGTPAMVAIFSLTVVLHIGLVGRDYPDYLREWWRRLGAWLLIFGVAWVGVFTLAIYGPLGLLWAGPKLKVLFGSGWFLATIAGLFAGKSPATGRPTSNRWIEIAAKTTPYVFAVGLLLLLSWGIHEFILYMLPTSETVRAQLRFSQDGAPFLPVYNLYWQLCCEALDTRLLAYFGVSLAVAMSLSLRVDINEFSMHNLYGNRLVRCYLGASRAQNRRAQPFSGFDPEDDLFLAHLVSTSCQVSTRAGAYDGPYPLINTTLNLVRGEELAWQERKAASFVFTPRYCGFEVVRKRDRRDPCAHQTTKVQPYGYRPTLGYAYTKGIYLGKAMAISGAAATPNMGFHTSAPLAFLMTMFNVRLGWWLGNPRREDTWQERGPRWGLSYLINELFAQTNDQAAYVYLSDGGHFENLGLYELVRRRCRFIVVCDAEEDRGMTFGAIAGAIRKCQTDFGIEIEIRTDAIRKDDDGRSQRHCAVGTIHYENVDPDAPRGTLVYLKASLTGNEPADVLNYASAHDDFPHQTTVDQWFDESQFESYRKLGRHIAETTFLAGADQPEHVSLEELVKKIKQAWRPPASGERMG